MRPEFPSFPNDEMVQWVEPINSGIGRRFLDKAMTLNSPVNIRYSSCAV